jgi:hypothetical protein
MVPFTYSPHMSLEEVDRALTTPGRLLEVETVPVPEYSRMTASPSSTALSAASLSTPTRPMMNVWKNIFPTLRDAWIGATERWRERVYVTFDSEGGDVKNWTYERMFGWSVTIASLLRDSHGVGIGDRGEPFLYEPIS